MRFRRYQLTKEAVRVVASGHPWLFKSHLSSAAEVFKSGEWLELVDQNNQVVGHGIVDHEGLIAIRLFNHSKQRPDLDSFKQRLRQALKKRENLRKFTDGFRAVHGENDGFPGIVVDVYKDIGVLQTYTYSVDPLGRWVASCLRTELGLRSMIWKLPAKRKSKGGAPLRTLYGYPQSLVKIKEGKLALSIEPLSGQKSGAFLDLRGLRKWLTLQKLQKARVLNLFSYTGTLGLAAEVGGATKIQNVDISQGALEAAEKHHTLDAKKHEFLKADIFEWLPTLGQRDAFELIIVDPPQMAVDMDQVKPALKSYQKLYKHAAQHLTPKGFIIACCCTSRIPRQLFRREVGQTLGPRFDLVEELRPEDDHPVGFPEGDYLKILIFRAKN